MSGAAVFRIVMWASAGFLVSAGWGFYFATADKATPIPSIVYTLALFSQPGVGAVTVLYPDLPVGLSAVVVANAATYALLGPALSSILLRQGFFGLFRRTGATTI